MDRVVFVIAQILSTTLAAWLKQSLVKEDRIFYEERKIAPKNFEHNIMKFTSTKTVLGAMKVFGTCQGYQE